jgi:hypothetical protein
MNLYLAAIRGRVKDIKWMVRRAGAIGRGESGFTIHFVVRSNTLDTFSQYPPPAEAYCSFNDSFLAGITLGSEQVVEIVVPTIGLLDALRTFYDDDFVELRFVEESVQTEQGEEYDFPAIHIRQGGLTYRVVCRRPVEKERAARDALVSQFDDSETFVTEGATNEFKQNPKTLEEIFDAIDDNPNAVTYSVITGNQNVKGKYQKDIKKPVVGLPGESTFYLDTDDNTLAIVSTNKAGCVLRYVTPSLDVDEGN